MIQIDTDKRVVIVDAPGGVQEHPFESPQAYAIVSEAWVQCGWDTKNQYTFTWFGRPIIQLPEDMVRVQEVIYDLKPDVVLETGIAHGGSLVYYASILKAMGNGRVIGVDIDIRPHNRTAIDSHELRPLITTIEGSSVDPGIVSRVKSLIEPGERVFIMLDSNHSKDHVAAELEAYHSLVSPGSYIVAADGIMRDLVGAPRTKPDWGTNNPAQAAREFVMRHPEFRIEQPEWRFNESNGLSENITYFRDGWLRKVG